MPELYKKLQASLMKKKSSHGGMGGQQNAPTKKYASAVRQKTAHGGALNSSQNSMLERELKKVRLQGQNSVVDSLSSLNNLKSQSMFMLDASGRLIDKSGRQLDKEGGQSKIDPAQLMSIKKKTLQQTYMQELEHLTSENCQKVHPFDFRPGDIADIKQVFPEFKKKRQSETSNPTRQNQNRKQMGVTVSVLKSHFEKVMELHPARSKEDKEAIVNLMEKLDHRDSDKITWPEFLKFLDHEGIKREMVNDAQLYGIGTKRMREKERINLRQTANQIEHYIDCCVFINFNNSFNFLLALFENNTAKIFDAQSFKIIQELNFPSKYGQPKTYRSVSTLTGAKRKKPSVVDDADKKKFDSTSRSQVRLKSNLLIKDSPFNSSMTLYQTGNQSRTREIPTKNAISRLQGVKKESATSRNVAKTMSRTQNIEDSIEVLSSTNLQIDSKLSMSPSKQVSKYLDFSKDEAVGAEQSSPIDKVSGTLAKQRPRTATRVQTGIRKTQRSETTLLQPKNLDVIGEENEEVANLFVKTVKIPIRGETKSTNLTGEEKRKMLLAQKNLLKYKYGRKLSTKPPKKMYGVLGLDSLQDEDGSGAYYNNKDEENQSSGYGMRKAIPDLYSNFGKNKDAFTKLMAEKEKLIKQNDKYIKMMEPYWDQSHQQPSEEAQLNKQNSRNSRGMQGETQSVESFLTLAPSQSQKNMSRNKMLRFQRTTDDKKIQEQMAQTLQKKKVVDEKINQTRVKMNKGQNWLQAIKETNKYFYRLNSPSPYVVAQQQYIKRQLEKKGVDTQNSLEVVIALKSMKIKYDIKMLRNITGKPNLTEEGEDPNSSFDNNYCTPEMITRYVHDLRGKELENQSSSMVFKRKEGLGEQIQNQRKQGKVMQTKAVYALCSNYNQELGLLGLSLIDKEIKVYRIKQNGAKIYFMEHISFHAKYIITCMCIDRCASNSRPIMFMGSKTGDIQLYYLDEPYIDPFTNRPTLDEKVHEKQHPCSPFNFFKPHQHPGVGLAAASNQAQGLKPHMFYGSTDRTEGQIDNKKENVPEKLYDHDIIDEESHSLSDGLLTFKVQSSTHQDDLPFDETIKADQEKQPAKKNYKVAVRLENEITCIRYFRDIGLICSTFNGAIKFFDAFDFNEKWCTMNKNRKEHQHTNITVFDVSIKLGLMATGGAEGNLILIDPYALGIINGVQAHQAEIMQLYIFDEQQQIITVAKNRSIGLWDASRLEKIEVIKDISDQIHASKFSSSAFDYQRGQLFVGCQQITVWEAQTDQKVEINALQIQTLSKDILKQRKMLDSQDPSFSQDNKNGTYSEQVKKNKDTDARTGSVLVTSASTLVEIVLNQGDLHHFLITIDSENLLRGWNIEHSLTTLTYRLPVSSRVTAAAVDATNKYLAVGTSNGQAKVINLKSGGVLYNLANSGAEVTALRFIDGPTEFWLFGSCWGGKLMMWTRPTKDNNFTISARCMVGHKTDVISLDCSQNFIVTGGVDGILSIWNIFSGQLKYAINMPKSIPQKVKKESDENESSSQKESIGSQSNCSDDGTKSKKIEKSFSNLKRSVVGICFHPQLHNHVCVLQDRGEIHMVDATNGVISYPNLAHVNMNSNWACDPSQNTMLVIGDVGRATLLDISMADKLDSVQRWIGNASAKEERVSQRSNSAIKLGKSGAAPTFDPKAKKHEPGRPVSWPARKEWFVAHAIQKMEPSYVVTVKFVNCAKLFVSGTTTGEVKLWSNITCNCLGVLNSQHWDPRSVLSQIESAQKEPRGKLILKTGNGIQKNKSQNAKSLSQLTNIQTDE